MERESGVGHGSEQVEVGWFNVFCEESFEYVCWFAAVSRQPMANSFG
jgi:hypothetical protein